MRAGSVSDSDTDVLVTGRRRRVVTVVQWHAAARARMVIALGWVMHDRMARVSDWGVVEREDEEWELEYGECVMMGGTVKWQMILG